MYNDLCTRSSSHREGEVPDISIMKYVMRWHKKTLKVQWWKENDDVCRNCDGEHDVWGVIADKRYQGIQHELRAVIPCKKHVERRRNTKEICYNANVASDRIVVERYFGKKILLWAFTARQFKCSEDQYDVISKLCEALTNFHMILNPLRNKDEVAYNHYRQKLYEKSVLKRDKHLKAQQWYRARKKRKLSDQLKKDRSISVFLEHESP